MKIDINFKPQSSKNYSIFIDELEQIELSGKVAIITNPTVAGFHLESLMQRIKADELHVISISDGEEYKNLEGIEYILNELFKLKFNRHSTLIALGGGVIGDMTGFCASIYQRGINFIQVPTTLLAQVDASVGGKTGVNNFYGKNLIGSFHQPLGVYCESEFLKTLPKREFDAGFSEVAKMAVILDANFFTWLEAHHMSKKEHLNMGIKKSIELKAKVVAEDEKEKGIRAALNYGHTFAHVIERQTGYKKYLHGEAVAMGMMMANALSCELGLLSKDESERIRKLLQSYDLPLDYKVKDAQGFYEALFLDKKSLDKNVLFVLPRSIGGFEFRTDVKKETVLKVLRKFS